MPKSKHLLRWGLLSTARINRALIPAIRLSKRSTLLAVGSRDQAKAREFAQKWDIPRIHASYEELLADKDIDVIYNPLPNSLHAEWSIRAVKAGKHVLCEKPLATSLSDVDAMQAASLETGKIIAEAFMYRHHPQTIQVKEMIAAGMIDKVQLLRGAFAYQATRPADVRMEPTLGGGSIWDVGCYPISYFRYLVGAEPEEVFGWQSLGPTGIDLQFTGQLRFPGEIYAHFHSSFISQPNQFIEIVGSQGIITVPQPFIPKQREKLLLRQGDLTQVIHPKGADLYLGEVVDIEDSILNGLPSRISLADSKNNIATILALLESARTGKPVNPALM